jgi:hypothetical protein
MYIRRLARGSDLQVGMYMNQTALMTLSLALALTSQGFATCNNHKEREDTKNASAEHQATQCYTGRVQRAVFPAIQRDLHHATLHTMCATLASVWQMPRNCERDGCRPTESSGMQTSVQWDNLSHVRRSRHLDSCCRPTFCWAGVPGFQM